MAARLFNKRQLKAGWAGLTTAFREVATRTDRAVQLMRLRIDLWELNRELLIQYREFGRRVSELALISSPAAGTIIQAQGETVPADDPEVLRVSGQIERLRARMELLTQQLATLSLEAPEDAGAPLRRRLQTAGMTDVVAIIPARSPFAHRPLAAIQPLSECVITAIIRNGTPFIPAGGTTLEPGDELMLFGTAMACEQAKLYLERIEEDTYPQSL
ncbi:MAG TPA: TrkA C-terminal domain-containing protein [Nitrospiria bacterium]|nr:TrkA C-terminal domain-containing protein [Nitrospiria bacterium]